MNKENIIKKQIAVIFGGQSGEHEVSIKSASQVIEALDRNKYDVIPIAITKSGYWLIGKESEEYLEENLEKASQEGGVKNDFFPKNRNKLPQEFPAIDLVLPIMHGTFGEDGKLQGTLEMLGLPYAFSGTLASALAMNKNKTKTIVKAVGLKVAEDLVIAKNEEYDLEKIIKKLNFPMVVKPLELGSSVGIELVNTKEELNLAIKKAFEYGKEVLLEKFIKGRELTVPVMGNQKPEALAVIEIIPKVAGWFDYKAKYEVGGSEEVCPAKIPEKIRGKVQSNAIKAFKAVGCCDLARADFIWDDANDEIYFLEINTIPGVTSTSLVPQSAQVAGMNFSIFLDRLIEMAFERYKVNR
jgi:D-alanine-D-alanine ligase